MALHTMKGVKNINGEEVRSRGDNVICPEDCNIWIDENWLGFKIQNGPIKEVGKNGCQVEDVVAVAKHIIEQLNAQFPCRENAMMITKLDEAILWSKKRTADREARNVEGKNQL